MKICDMHTHSNNSFDAESSVEQICLSAIDSGLYAVAITDHCEAPEIDNPYGECGCFDILIPKSVDETMKAKEKFASKIKVICGLELGEPLHNAECTKRALNYGDFDFTLASVHNLKNMRDFYHLDYSKLDINKILKLYFAELAETAEFEYFDSLAHLTYPLRYIKAKTGVVPDLSVFDNEIDRIFKILIKNNKALEINVSGLFKELGATLPDEPLIRRFKELGGKYITIGTDAHNAEYVGKGIEEGIAVARRCGFTQYAIYEKHRPIMLDFC